MSARWTYDEDQSVLYYGRRCWGGWYEVANLVNRAHDNNRTAEACRRRYYRLRAGR